MSLLNYKIPMIYSIIRYYPVNKVFFDINEEEKKQSDRLLKMKRFKNEIEVVRFYELVKNKLIELDLLNTDTMIALVPGHEASDTNCGATAMIAKRLINIDGMKDGIDLIKRIKTIPKKAYSGNDRPKFKDDLESMDINKNIDVSNKKIVILDDITTTGNSLNAARNLLINNGVNEDDIILLAIGRTVF